MLPLKETSTVMPASSLLPPLRRSRFVVTLKSAISDILMVTPQKYNTGVSDLVTESDFILFNTD